eukprot:1565221-Pleurochrysis_carterae.AAC.3
MATGRASVSSAPSCTCARNTYRRRRHVTLCSPPPWQTPFASELPYAPRRIGHPSPSSRSCSAAPTNAPARPLMRPCARASLPYPLRNAAASLQRRTTATESVAPTPLPTGPPR